MLSELEKIDIIRARTGVTFREAKQYLDEAGGDVVQALMNMEEEDKVRGQAEEAEEREGFFYERSACCQDVVEQFKNALKKGHKTRIKVKQGERVVLELPAAAGAVGLLAALASSELALLGALGAVTAMAKKYSLEFEQQDSGDHGTVGH